ncbi:MAG TPA: phosphatidylserine/phosphatidylglycerophosphate/cardiolipin synthase family protein [Gaiellaceae bacterium]
MIDVRTLTDGGQTSPEIAQSIADFLGAAERTLDIALYDVRLHDPSAQIVRTAFDDARGRGVAIRLAYNVDHGKKIPVPPPPKTEPSLLETLGVPTCQVPGVPDLMHHKFVIRDGSSVWCGSTNWTDDSWEREENVIVTVDSAAVAANYTTDFEQLWTTREVWKSGKVPTDPIDVDGVRVRTWFSPKRGERLAHRIADKIGRAMRRVRIASPVITSGPVLGTLAEAASDGKLDLAGIVDLTQIHEVLSQWAENSNSAWKSPALHAALTRAPFAGKRSTPYAPGSVHDYMHAKVTIADDTVFVGSFNLSHSGEQNAENVLEIDDPRLADRMAAYIDELRARYPPVDLDRA